MIIAQQSSPSFRVRRHVVPVPNDSSSDFGQWATQQRLSPMQRALLDPHGGTVRVVDAPTGSGKSFAFQKAVLRSSGVNNPGNVLFIAPTRRLSDALAKDLRQNLAQEMVERGQTMDTTLTTLLDHKVLLWNGGQIITGSSARAQRLQELETPNYHPQSQDLRSTVFTVMEILEKMMFPYRLQAGTIDEHTFQFLGNFQHIVFDEFHTLDKGAMALAVLVASIVSRWRAKSRAMFCQEGVPVVTFLSATPINVEKLLEAAGIPPFDPTTQPDGYQRIQETVVDRNDDQPLTSRVLHGDVSITLEDHASPLGMMAAHLEKVKQEILADRQVVVVYNELSALRRDTMTMGTRPSMLDELIHQLGMNARDVLVINSADDRTVYLDGQGGTVDLQTIQVAQKDTHRFKLLLATSSVEAGVTFKDNRLLFMDPGMNPLSFMQRVGRTARGAMNGEVFVRYDDDMIEKLGHVAKLTNSPQGEWLGKLVEITRVMSDLPDGISIHEFQEMMKSLAHGGHWPINPVAEIFKENYYKNVSQSMVTHMRLYWAMQMFLILRRFPANPPQLLLDMKDMEPKEVADLRAEMKSIDQFMSGLRLTGGRLPGDGLRRWWRALQVAILDLRNIGTTVEIEDVNSAGQRRRRPLSLVHVLNKTSLINHVTVVHRDDLCVLVCDGNADSFYDQQAGMKGVSAREWNVRNVMNPYSGLAAENIDDCKSVCDVVDTIAESMEKISANAGRPEAAKKINQLRTWMKQTNLIVWCPDSELNEIIAGCMQSIVL